MKRVIIINGPNLNMLGSRENDIYGSRTFEDIYEELESYAKQLKIELSYFQSNIEGEIINRIHESRGIIDYFVINPGALTHYSYSLHDALKSVNIPAVEVHMSNIFSREQWRSKSVISPAAEGVISGFGEKSYNLALFYISGL